MSHDTQTTDPLEQPYEQVIAQEVSSTLPAVQLTQADRQNIVLVDPSLLITEQLSADSVRTHFESTGYSVALLDGTDSGIDQLDSLFNSNAAACAIELLTTADADGIRLGGAPLSVNAVLNNMETISSWSHQIDTDSAFRIHASGLSGYADGEHLSELLARLVGVEVGLSSYTGLEEVVPSQQELRRELVFVDTGVEGYEDLVADLQNSGDDSRTLEVILLDPDRDGVEQLTELLQAYQNLDAIHIVSHGSDASVQIAGTTLSSESLDDYATALASWRGALSDDADLLIYGCDLAATETGKALIGQIADLTGADVAASDDLTGAQLLGGDWELEFAEGDIEAQIAFSASLQDRWIHVLATTPETLVNQTTTSLQEANFYGGGSIAADADGNYVVVWQDNSGGSYDVYARLFNADGTPSSNEFLVNSTTADDQRSASVAMDADGDFVVTWTSNDQDQTNTYGVYAQRFDAGGVAQGSEFQVNTSVSGDQWRTKVGMDDAGNFAIAFTDDQSASGDVYLQRYSAAGTALGANTQINTTTASTQSYSDIAVDGATGNIVVVWESLGQDGDQSGIYARLLDSSGTAISAETQVNVITTGSQENAKVAFAPDGGFVVAWDNGSDMSVRTFDASGVPVSGEIVVNTTTAGQQGFGDVSVDADGRFVVAWAGHDGGGTYTIEAQLFAADGTKIGSELLVNETSSGYRSDVSVDFVGGTAVFSWSGEGTGDADGVYSRSMQFTDLIGTSTSAGGLSINQDGGNDTYLLADDGSALLGGLTALTFETQFSTLDATNQALVSYTRAGNLDEFKLVVQGDGDLLIDIGTTQIFTSAFDFRTLADGDPHSVAFTWDNTSGDWTVYVNGAEVDSGTGLAVGESIVSGGTLVFGNEQDEPGAGFDVNVAQSATLFDIRVFDDVRSAAEVAASYQSSLAHSEANMVANWQFDNLSVDGVIIEAVSGNNLTIQHAAGLAASDPSLTFPVSENAIDGTVIGQVSVVDAQREALIASLLAADPDLVYSAETGKFYKLSNTVQSWVAANTAASSELLNGIGAELVTIHSEFENSIVFSMAQGVGDVYIGATDANVEGEFYWYAAGTQTGDRFWTGDGSGQAANGAFSRFHPGEPQNSPSDRDYVELDSTTGNWYVETSANAERSVVQWNVDEVLDATQVQTYAIQSQTIAGAFAIDADSGQITVADGSLLDYETATTHNVDVEVTDAGGNSYSETMTIVIDNEVEAAQTVPVAQTIDEDTALTFSSGTATEVSVTDTFGTTDSRMRVTLSVGNGVLNLSQTTGLIFVEGANDSGSFVIDGSESDINAALNGMTFTPDSDFSGSVTLNMTSALAAGLDGHYTFAGGTAGDQSAGSAYDGTLIGDAAVVSDPERGEVIALDGIGDYVQVSGLLGEPTDVTLAAWIDLDAVDTLGAVAISMGTSPALYMHTDGTVIGYYESGGVNNVIQSTESVLGTGWRHIAVSIDAMNSSMTLYIDGIAVESSTSVGAIEYDNSPDTYIGRAGDGLGGFDFSGSIDDARIYSRALSADEIAALAIDPIETTGSVAITVDPVNDAPTFALPGQAIFTEGNWGYGQNQSSIVLADGSMLITPYDSNGDSNLVKLNSDGTIDTSFGNSGYADNAAIGYIQSATEQPDGKILVSGSDGGNIFLARYHANGSLDTDFGVNGVASLTTGTFDGATDVAVQSDGSIVLVGEYGDDSIITRFTSAGIHDTTFGSGGNLIVNLGGTFENLESVAILSDDSIVAVGETSVVKMDSNGTLDTGFDADGILNVSGNVYGVTAQADGKFVVVGDNGTSLFATRFNTDGSVDTDFGTNGTATWSDSAATGYSVVQQSDGKLVVAGFTDAYPTQWVVVRFATDGSLDTTFGTGGAWVQTTSTDFSEAYSVGLYNDGSSEKIVIGGYTTREGFEDSTWTTVIRLNQNGSLDSSLSENTLDANPRFIEDGAPVVLDADVSIFDQELSSSNNFDGASLTIARNGAANADDVLSFNDGNGITLSGSDLIKNSQIIATFDTTTTLGELVITFTDANGQTPTGADVDAIMRQIAYSNSSDTPPNSVQMNWTFNDGNTASAQGTGPAGSAMSSTTVDIVDSPDGAVLTVPVPQSVDEDTPMTFSTGGGNAIVIDSGSSNDPILTATLSVANGTLTLFATTGITFLDGTSDGDATITISGTESNINSALNGLQYQGDQDYNGSDTLTVSTGSDAATEANMHARYEFLGGVTADQSGNGYNGSPSGDPTSTSDAERGDVMTFDGDDQINVTNSVSSLGNEVTISAWVNLAAGQQDNVFLSIGDEFYIILDNSNASLSMGVHVNGFTTSSLSSANNIAGEGWNHVAATINDVTKETDLYLNGQLIRSSSYSFSDIDWNASASANITIGAMSDGSDAFTGSLDDVRVYNSQLSQTEIVAIMGDHGYDNETVAITVDAVNDASVIDLDADDSVAAGINFAATWTEAGGPVSVADGDATLSDIDSLNLNSLTVTITNMQDGAAELLAADTTGTLIGASYDSATGVLTLSGSDSVANYQQVLRTITYDNSFDYPNETTRIISFQASDGVDDSSIAMTTLDMVGITDAGVTITAGTTGPVGEQITVSQTEAGWGGTYLTQAVAMDPDGITIVVWTSDDPAADGSGEAIMARRYDAQGNPIGDEFLVNTTTAGNQFEASVAVDDDGNFVVIWTSDLQDGSGWGVYGQRYDTNGVAQGGEFLVNTTTSGNQYEASVSMDADGDFIVVWYGSGAGDSDGVFGQRFDASGVAQGGEFLINEVTAGSQRFAEVATDATGNFVVTWSSSGQDGDDWGVYLRRFDNTGNALGSEELVNSNTTGRQWLASIDMNESGEFAVAYSDLGQPDELYLQRYNADGTTNGTEIAVPSTTVAPNYTQVAIDDGGNITVVWQDFLDSDDASIMARQFDSSGNPLGAQFLINTNEAANQEHPAIAMNGDGQFVVVFTDNDKYGDGQETIEMRRYSATTSEAGGTTSFDFVLDTQPTDDVTITLSMPDGTEGTLSTTSLTFTSLNWNVTQTVTVTGIDDSIGDGNVTHLLVTSSASSLDSNYSGLAVRDVSITNIDDDPSIDLDADDSAAAGIDFVASWTEAGGPISVVDTDATLANAGSANLTSLTVTITNHWDGPGELLAADTTGTSISASYDSVTGVLTLSGADTVANYQQVLRTITYDNTHATPYSEARVLDFVAIDGADTSQVASTTVGMNVTQGVLIVTNLSDDVNGDVTSIDDLIATQGGDGISLREAILAANNSANGSGPDLIRFDVAGSGPHRINLTSQLPTITQAILIDGSSEPDFAGTPMVVLDGSAAGAGAKAFYLGAGSDGSTIRGLVMHSFSTGIEIAGSDNNLIAGNYFGLGADGSTNEGNTNNGIRLVGGSSNNTIGGLSAVDRNVIAGSGSDGISISGAGTTANHVLGNYIGTSADGTSAVANAVGIRIQNSATGNFVGGTTAGAGNIVSGNTGAGIAIDATSDNQTIQGNWVGLDQTGLAALGNGLAGIDATSNNNQIGGAGLSDGNVISGNAGAGVDLDGDSNFVEGNIIGLDAAAAGVLGNGGAGVFLSNGAATNNIGGTTAGAGNVISGNIDGIYIQDATGTTIQGNLIGTDGTGLLDRGNLDRGIQIESGGDDTIIGGNTASALNVISANGTDGIILSDGSSPGTGTTGVVMQGNFIGVGTDGTTALGNGANGIRITTVSGHLLGGSSMGAGNLIAYSGQDGIVIGAATATDNTILGNIIHSNTERAVDLSNDGTTSNDASANLDADAGANDLQNFAVLYTAEIFGSDLQISGDLDSEANSSYRIEFFNNPLGQEDASGYGEARELLGFIVVTTDGTGNASIDTTLNGVSLSAGDRVTSTTTQIVDAGQVGVNDILAYGSTSEFSMNLPAADGDPAPTIDLDADDSSGGASSNYITSFTEGDGQTLIADSDAILADPESANLTSLTVTISNLLDGTAEVLAADVSGTSISSSYDSGTGVLTLSGSDSVANYQQVLRTITYDNTSQAPDTTLRTVSFVASDGTNDSNLAITAISMNAVNDAPINSVPGTQTVSEETTTAIAGISISDVDAESLNVTTQLQVGSGVLNVALSGSATVSAGTNGTGNLTILGTVTDVNATLATLTYTGDSNVIGVAADTLTITTNDGANTGSGGALQDIDTVQIDITNVNDAPTGNVLIDNTSPSQGDTLTASNTIADADGISGPISYQWYRDGVAVSGATGPTYVTAQVDVGAVITVAASYTDDQGAVENVTSAGTAAVANVNDPLTGQPTIVGTTTEDQTLSVDTSAIGDEDGLGTFSYQWYRDGVAIAGATAGVYTLEDTDVDHVLTVNVSFVDGYGAAESTTSNATATIANVNDAPAGSVDIDNLNPEQGDTLTVSNTLSDADGLSGPISYQWYRDGVAISGATGATYTTAQVDVGTVITTIASYTDDQGTAESVTSAGTAAVANVNDAVTGQPVILGTPTEDQTLTVDTSGISDADGLGTFSYQWYRDGVAIGGATADSHVLGDADVDSNITIAVSYMDGQGTAETTASAAVGPITNVDDAPAGSVNIDNLSPAQGDVLTASNTLTDADGLSGAITYQWYRDGAAIAGATSTSYATVQADVGAEITAIASYTDDQGNAESVASGATALVTNLNDPVTGQPVIIGTTTEDQTLTIDTSAISDEDGLGAFNYQWYRDGVAISGATSNSYVLGDADVDSNIGVMVAFTDGYGAAESTTSDSVGLIANVNDAPAGSVDIDNLSPVQGDTLTVSNTLSDADGLSGAISYQWYRDGVAISGASGATYTTVQVDVGAVMTAVASYTDDQGTAATVTSAATATVANANDAVSGQPVILDTPTEDQVLTIDTSGISDADGLGTFNYQWFRDGVAVAGAAGNTYVLDDADVGANISVAVSYVDGYGQTETTTSSAVGPIANVNDVPVVTPGLTFSVLENSPAGTLVGQAMAADADIAATLGNWRIASGNAEGVFSIDVLTGEIRVADNSALDFETNPVFTLGVTVSDGSATSAIVDVLVNLTNLDEAPVVSDDQLVTNEDTPLVIIGASLLVNGSDPESAPLTLMSISQPVNGIVMDQLDGTWLYQPNPDFYGVEQITYTVSDGVLQTTAQLEIVVNAVNDAPVISTPNFLSIQEDATRVVDISVLDIDGDLLTFSLTGGADAEAFELDATSGTLRFSDSPDFEAPADANQDNLYELMFTVSDSNGGQTLHALQVDVENVNETPTLTSTSMSATSTGSGSRIGQLSAFDPDTGDTLSFEIIGGDSAELFAVDTVSGELYESTQEIPVGLYRIDVQITDAAGLSSTAVIEVAITQSSDANTSTVADLMPDPNETDSNDTPPSELPGQIQPTPVTPQVSQATNESDVPTQASIPLVPTDQQQGGTTGVTAGVEQLSFNPVLLPHIDGSEKDRPGTGLDQHAELSVRLILSESSDGAFAAVGALVEEFKTLTLPISAELSEALDALARAAQAEDTEVDLRVSGAVVGTMSLSAGFIAWMLRGGSLMASILSSKPMWTEFDPLPIFSGETVDVDPDHPFQK